MSSNSWASEQAVDQLKVDEFEGRVRTREGQWRTVLENVLKSIEIFKIKGAETIANADKARDRLKDVPVISEFKISMRPYGADVPFEWTAEDVPLKDVRKLERRVMQGIRAIRIRRTGEIYQTASPLATKKAVRAAWHQLMIDKAVAEHGVTNSAKQIPLPEKAGMDKYLEAPVVPEDIELPEVEPYTPKPLQTGPGGRLPAYMVAKLKARLGGLEYALMDKDSSVRRAARDQRERITDQLTAAGEEVPTPQYTPAAQVALEEPQKLQESDQPPVVPEGTPEEPKAAPAAPGGRAKPKRAKVEKKGDDREK